MDQQIINLYDEYTHKPLDRKEFISRLIKLVGSASAAMALLPLLDVNYAKAAIVPEQDENIITEDISYDGDGTVVKGYLARPRKKGKYGSVIVIHENRGLNPHIRDVTRRVAKAGYLAYRMHYLHWVVHLLMKTKREHCSDNLTHRKTCIIS